MLTCSHCGTKNPPDSSFCIECGKPLAASDTMGGLETQPYEPPTPTPSAPQDGLHLEPGAVFAGRYTIIEQIGQGGMGVVYRASEELAGRTRDIALKLIRADRLADQKAIDKLISEGALTQDIRHPNVVAVYNVGEADGQPFVAMEFVEGHSLREWHRRQINARQEVSLATAAGIVRELLDGLEAAHRLGIVHRDLKPENVILTGEPGDNGASLQILDFGIARAPGTIDHATGTGLGTPRYMAPEQITHPDSAGPPADLYSLSVVFYELLMDVLPQGHWQPPSGGRNDVPPAIDKLIEKGLSNRPADRPQSTAEYQQRLAAALGDAPPVPVPDDGGDEEGKGKSGGSFSLEGNRKWLAAGGAAVLGLVVLGALFGDDDLPDDPVIPVEPFDPDDPFGGGQPVQPDGPVGPAPDPVTPAPSYQILSGRWNATPSGVLDIVVDGNGDFYGQGRNGQGFALEIGGSIPDGGYQISDGSIALPGRLSWDGACHLDFTTFNPDGSVNISGQFHVDHAPGAPCPARFGR